jgi:hypothetical protein
MKFILKSDGLLLVRHQRLDLVLSDVKRDHRLPPGEKSAAQVKAYRHSPDKGQHVADHPF